VWYERALVPVGVLTVAAVVDQRRLGELYVAKGDTANAIAHYQKFVTLWKSADPELQPQVEDVRKRISRLERLERRSR
jgi:hypothetical protein